MKKAVYFSSQQRLVESIESNRASGKAEKKRAVAVIRKVIQENPPEALNQLETLNKLVKFSCRLFREDSEAVRQTSTENVILLLEKINGAPTIFAGLIPALEYRLGAEQIIEECEELRLGQVKILLDSCQKYPSQLGGYMNELAKILTRTLQDPFHEIRLLSTQLLLVLIKNYPTLVHQYAELLIMPLVNSLNHQQSRVRGATTDAMLKLLKIAAPELLRKNLSYVVQRCFDDSVHVRRLLWANVLDYLLTYRDRYSFFNLLIPVYFGFLDDADYNLASDAAIGWVKVGEQFEKENYEDMKEEIDYPRQPAKHYPKDEERPNLGCRELVGRNILGMLPALGRDCGDNLNADNRLMASGVLARIVQHSERVIHQHVPKVIEIISKGAQDTLPEVLEKHRSIARWLCVLADTELILKLLLPGIQGLSIGSLVILEQWAALETEAEPMESVLDALNGATGHFYRDDKIVNVIRSIVRDLSTKLTDTDLDHQKLFNVEIFCRALASKKDAFDDDVIQNIVYKTFTTRRDVLNDLGPSLCKQLDKSVKCWNVTSGEYSAWACVLEQFCRENAQEAVTSTIPTMEYLLRPGEENTRVRLNVMELLFNFASNNENLFKPILSRLVSLVTKNIVFRAGRIETALRVLGTGVLCLIIPTLEPEDQINWYSSFKEQIHSCLDDDELVTRTNTLKLIANLLNQEPRADIEIDFLHQLLVPLMQRLDDACDKMRVLSGQCVGRVFTLLSSERAEKYDCNLYGAHLEYALAGLFLHGDDPNETVASAVVDALKIINQIDPSRVAATAKEHSGQMKHADRIRQFY